MPLYDFRCRVCRTEFEARVGLGELAVCEACGSSEVERVISGFAGPFTIAARGAAAKRSDDSRRVRRERRVEQAQARPPGREKD
jgi:putative FmdB family regulatory protein